GARRPRGEGVRAAGAVPAGGRAGGGDGAAGGRLRAGDGGAGRGAGRPPGALGGGGQAAALQLARPVGGGDRADLRADDPRRAADAFGLPATALLLSGIGLAAALTLALLVRETRASPQSAPSG